MSRRACPSLSVSYSSRDVSNFILGFGGFTNKALAAYKTNIAWCLGSPVWENWRGPKFIPSTHESRFVLGPYLLKDVCHILTLGYQIFHVKTTPAFVLGVLTAVFCRTKFIGWYPGHANWRNPMWPRTFVPAVHESLSMFCPPP